MTLQLNAVACDRGRKGFDAEIQWRLNPFTPQERTGQVVIKTGCDTRAEAIWTACNLMNEFLTKLESFPRAQE